MNKTEAKLLILIGTLDFKNCNVHYLAAKVEKSFSATYNYLRMLEAREFIKRIKSSRGSFYSLTSTSVLEEAKKSLSEV